MRRLSLLAALLVGLAAACFTAPSDDVLFSCEQNGDDRCPPDYRCEADNCCHRIGSDVQENYGACALGGNSGSGSGSESSSASETSSGSTDTGTDTGGTTA